MFGEFLKKQLAEFPLNSGVYQFFNEKGDVLYIGKAKNLKKRLVSYTKEKRLSPRIIRMVNSASKIDFTITKTEVEALLLEHNLIKKLAPKYNILLRDDKTFPQILISDHEFPRICKYRNHERYSKINIEAKSIKPNKNQTRKLFGPFASTKDVHKVLDIFEKVFQLRSCTDQEFKSRKKPCFKFQIKRCLAPCVKEISPEEYANQIDKAVKFLSGKTVQLQKDLKEKMVKLSANFEYEKAAEIRDQIQSLDAIQAKQNINLTIIDNIDNFVIHKISNKIIIYVSFYRFGQNFGSKPYFYNSNDNNLDDFLADFLGQFYINHEIPSEIWTNIDIKEQKLMEEYLANISAKKVKILTPKRGEKFQVVQDLQKIAIDVLKRDLSSKATTQSLLIELKNTFNLLKIPQKIEVYDNSHTSTENAVGALITAGIDGFIKSKYRKFNIRFDLSKNRDDTSMLKEVLTRRFSKIEKEEYPDFIIIDGGKGQLSAVKEVFDSLKVAIPFICMSKGENRNAGEEWFHRLNQQSITLEKHSPLMHYLQRLRDEAHRFAITSHRIRRSKNVFEK